jgi:hypothetical protein
MVFLALCVLAFSCKERTTRNQTDTTATTSATAAASTTTSAAFSEFMLKRLDQNLAIRRALGATPANTLRVIFRGMVVHVFDTGTGGSGVERAVMIDASGHTPTIDFPDSMQTALEKALGKSAVKCHSGVHLCMVDFKGLAFQIADKDGKALSGFSPIGNFNIVTKLTNVPGVGSMFDRQNLDSDLFESAPKASGVVDGFFELGGGKGDAKRFGCQGRFNGQKTFTDFPRFVFVDFPLSTGTQLQVQKTSGGWVKLVDLTGSPVIDVLNLNSGGMGQSDFDSFKNISKMPSTLPAVENDQSDCTSESGDVPGCSNSQWP